uniref:CSON005367 protein n=1 Tax=Culicoides sonorensis TaxID=179676 RepID=A0A336L645_CULSO
MGVKEIFCIIFYCIITSKCINGYENTTTLLEGFVPRRSNDTGRALIFNKGGTIRMVCGFLCPTFIPKWQNINVLNNWSVGFSLPTLATDWLSKFSGNTNWAVVKRSMMDVVENGDNTRDKFYKFIVNEFNRFGSNGYQCLLRTICEVAEAPIRHNGLIGELFHLVFTPGDKEKISEEFKLAKKAGYHGANCQELYHECPYGHGFMEKFSVLGDLTSKYFLNAFK